MTLNRRNVLVLATVVATGTMTLLPTVGRTQEPVGSSSGAFTQEYPAASALLSAADGNLDGIYSTLQSGSHLPADIGAELVGRFDGSSVSVPGDGMSGEIRGVLSAARELQRKILDVYADSDVADRIQAVERLTDEYLHDATGKLQPEPKSKEIMLLNPSAVGHGMHHGGEAPSHHAISEGSTTFAVTNPEANRILWAQVWLENALLEAVTRSQDVQARDDAVSKVIAKFGRLLEGSGDPPLPSAFPATPAIAPDFTARHPRASVILNHLHMLEIALLDALSAPTAEEREVRVAKLTGDFTDPEHLKISVFDWYRLSLRAGIYFQGGPATREMERSDRNAGSMFNQEGHENHIIMQGMPVM